MTATKTEPQYRLYVEDAGPKGRGVFAGVDMAKGEVIEVSPALVLQVNTSETDEYVYRHEYEDEDGNDECEYWLGLGFTSLYNHSYHANAEFDLHDCENGSFVELIAHRDIKCGEEIMINYNGDPDDETEVDFEVTL